MTTRPPRSVYVYLHQFSFFSFHQISFSFSHSPCSTKLADDFHPSTCSRRRFSHLHSRSIDSPRKIVRRFLALSMFDENLEDDFSHSHSHSIDSPRKVGFPEVKNCFSTQS